MTKNYTKEVHHETEKAYSNESHDGTWYRCTHWAKPSTISHPLTIVTLAENRITATSRYVSSGYFSA